MPITTVHWRVEIGVFNLRSFMRVAKSIFSANFRTTLTKYLFMLLRGINLLLICGDEKPKPAMANFSLFY